MENKILVAKYRKIGGASTFFAPCYSLKNWADLLERVDRGEVQLLAVRYIERGENHGATNPVH